MIASIVRQVMHPDPLLSSRFHVEIDGLIFAGFSEVSGLNVEIETEEYFEGGSISAHTLPKAVKYPNIVLKQGILNSDQMWNWIQDVADDIITVKSGRIILMGPDGEPAWYWTFEDAFPVKWAGTDLKATAGDPFVETLELSHNGIKKVKA